MEKANKRKAKAVALATAAVLVLAGTIAYLADASGTIRNVFDNEHIRVQINETGITDGTKNIDNGDKPYTILPGTSESKDPTITVDTDTDAYVFAVVKDTINSHKATPESTGATKFVNYTIADGWVELDKANLAKKENVKKYIDILNNKTDGNLTVDPGDPNTRIYYRKVHGAESDDHSGDNHRFTYNLLTNDQISYPTTLTNEDMNLLNSISEKEQKALIFQTWAIQMKPFCPDDEIAETDLTEEDQQQYAKDAWNETTVVPTGVTVSQAQSLNTVKVGDTLPLTATVTPKNAVDKTVTWTSSDESIATVDANGVVTGVAEGGPVTITATATAGDDVTGTYQVTVTNPHILWQVQLAPGYTAGSTTVKFWPAMTNSYGKHEHTGYCICDYTWEEIASGNYDFSHCTCTKTVTIDETKNTDIFNTLSGYVKSGMLYSSLKSDARKWEISGDRTVETPSYKTTLAAMKNASDVKDVAGDFFLLSKSDVESSTDASGRIVYNESDSAGNWWLATPIDPSDIHVSFDNDDAYLVEYDGNVAHYDVNWDGYGIAPGFSISKNN